MFTALVAESRAHEVLPCAGDDSDRGPFESCAHQMLSRDFLAPTIGSALYSDLLQRFLPFPVTRFDRGRALEGAWEEAWNALPGISTPRFGARSEAPSFDDLWCDAAGDCDDLFRNPLLFLNTTQVETGKRVIISPVPIVRSEFSDATGLFDEVPRSLSLSSAVHNSANRGPMRFGLLSSVL